ncbi:MAG TPA: arsenate reductase (azurin) small subunit [Conexivisphaerales archaeon]|nr:arsenate reductase (azurin) small subunit [Conexivisphaerales archaeon]
MTAGGHDESQKGGKVSRRNFVTGVGAGALLAAVAVAGIESVLNSKSAASVVTSTVTGPTKTVAGPTTTETGPTTTQTSTVTNMVTGPTTTQTSTVTNTVTSTPAAAGFPIVKVANVSQISANTPVAFSYPLADEPNMLVKIGQKAQGGVGPDGDIVAFSTICQHQGCTAGYVATAPSPEAVCPCHNSVFDLVHGGKVLSGPAPFALPQVMLEVDSSGDIYAYSMGPPTIFGHNTGSGYVSADLQG